MSVAVIDLPPTADNMQRCTSFNGTVHLDGESRRRNQRRYVKLHKDAFGYFIVDRFRRRRSIIAVRMIAIDGEVLNCGTAVLEREEI